MNLIEIQAAKAKNQLEAAKRSIDMLVSMNASQAMYGSIFNMITAANTQEYFDECITKAINMDPVSVSSATCHFAMFLIKLDKDPELFKSLVESARLHLMHPAKDE